MAVGKDANPGRYYELDYMDGVLFKNKFTLRLKMAFKAHHQLLFIKGDYAAAKI